MRLLTWYDELARTEVFAEAMAVNTIGESAHLPRYTGRDGIPGRPTLRDIYAAGEAVIEWCPIETCGVPRLATEIVWLHSQMPQALPRSGSSSSTSTRTAAEVMHEAALARMLAGALFQCTIDSYLVRFDVPTVDPRTGEFRSFEEMRAEREQLRQEWVAECQDEVRRAHNTT